MKSWSPLTASNGKANAKQSRAIERVVEVSDQELHFDLG